MSPQQLWLLEAIREVDGGADAVRAFEDKWLLTPATSDLYQAAMTMVEAHARFLPMARVDAPSVPQKAADRCAARTPEDVVAAFSPEEAETWLLVEKIGAPSLEEGVLVANGINGVKLLTLARAKDWKEVKNSLGVKNLTRAHKLQTAILRNVSTKHDAIPPEETRTKLKTIGAEVTFSVGQMLRKCLDPAVEERYVRAKDAILEGLGGRNYDISKAVGSDRLPAAALVKSHSHADTVVDETLGGLTKRLVQYDDMPGALASCAEWMGVSSEDARPGAISVYCKLLKESGSELRRLDLSKTAHGHWRYGMLSGEGVMRNLAAALSAGGAAVSLEEIDLTDQKEIEDGWLEILLGEVGAMANLRTLKLPSCKSVASNGGTLPEAIGGCTSLVMLNLLNCDVLGPPLPDLLRWLAPCASTLRQLNLYLNDKMGGSIPAACIATFTNLTFLNLGRMSLEGGLPKELGELKNLITLGLGFNRLSGPIPKELGNLTRLKALWLKRNKLIGPIPKELGNLTRLEELMLDNNQLTGIW